jgi:hypothetical protein
LHFAVHSSHESNGGFRAFEHDGREEMNDCSNDAGNMMDLTLNDQSLSQAVFP